MAYAQSDRVIALAGVLQSAILVNQVAQNKHYDKPYFNALIQSILTTDPTSTLDVFGGDINNIALGLEAVRNLNKLNETITRYAISLLAVESQLRKRPDILATIGRRLKHLQHQIHSDDEHSQLQRLSGVYQDTISTLPFRIQVMGDKDHLTQALISDKIRAILFAGVRSALLWRQVGGSKWQVVLGKTRMKNIANQLLSKPS